MANEATIHASIHIVKRDASGNTLLDWRSSPQVFRALVTGVKGPCPGAFQVTTAGVSVDFSELTTPGLCWITNLSDDYRFDIGSWDPDNSKFLPMFEVLPHEFYIFRIAQNLTQEYGTGTGTTGAASNALRLKAIGGTVNVVVAAFEV